VSPPSLPPPATTSPTLELAIIMWLLEEILETRKGPATTSTEEEQPPFEE